MEERQLVCGDAYAFQGDERDVMFLSLVSAPSEGRRIGTLADETARRRFNVAVSRARDQLVLFHTATLNDLSDQCLRYTLLRYCQNPAVERAEVFGRPVADLQHLAATADRDRIRAPEPFESWFELDVFLKLAVRGYRILPQYEVAGYRIDLVVEGMKRRIAVECDGDRWHGPDRYEEDMARQRMLGAADGDSGEYEVVRSRWTLTALWRICGKLWSAKACIPRDTGLARRTGDALYYVPRGGCRESAGAGDTDHRDCATWSRVRE